MLSTAGLDLIVRGFAHTVGTTAGLMAVADKAGELVRVLSAWGDAMALDDLPTSLTGDAAAIGLAERVRSAVDESAAEERGGAAAGRRAHPRGRRGATVTTRPAAGHALRRIR